MGHALLTATHVLNRIPSKFVPKTPHEMRSGRKPSLKHIKIWGCSAFIKKTKVDKLESRSLKGCFIGYPDDSMGYLFYLPDDQRIIVALQAIFLEEEFIREGGEGRKIVLEE